MKNLTDNLSRFGVGQKAFTEDDFFRLCEAENVSIIWSPEKFSFYFNVLDRGFIVLPKRKKGLKLLFSMLHEWAHHKLHGGSEPVALWEGMLHTKNEAEADAIALVALIPKDKMSDMAFLDGSRFGAHLWNERMRLYFLYDI